MASIGNCMIFSSRRRRRRSRWLRRRRDLALESLELRDAAFEYGDVLVDGFRREVACAEGVNELFVAQLTEHGADPAGVFTRDVLADPDVATALDVVRCEEACGLEQNAGGCGWRAEVNGRRRGADNEFGADVTVDVTFVLRTGVLERVRSESGADVADDKGLTAGLLVGVDRVVGVLEIPVVEDGHHDAQAVKLAGIEERIALPLPDCNFGVVVGLTFEARVDDLLVVHELCAALHVDALDGCDVEQVVVVDVVADGPEKT